MAVRLGILINCLEAGGAQRVALSLYKNLYRTLDFVKLYQIHEDIHSIHEAYGLPHNFNKVLTATSNDSGFFYKSISTSLAFKRLLSNIRQDKINIMLSFIERSNILNLLTLGKHKKIISIRNYPSTFFRRKSFFKKISINLAYSILLKRTDVINFNSYEAAQDFAKLFSFQKDRISVIYNMVDVDNVNQLSQLELPLEHQEIFNGDVIINVARLVKQKGQDRLIRAFSLVSKGFPDSRLVIIGDGPLYEGLKNLIKGLGLLGRVFLLGHLPNPFPYVRRARIFVLSSLNEGFPNSLVEAMALGRPIVASDCSSGPREILGPGTDIFCKATQVEFQRYGILVPPFSENILGAERPTTESEVLLAKAIEALLSNAEIRKKYGEMSMRRAMDFAPSTIISQWVSLLETQVCSFRKQV